MKLQLVMFGLIAVLTQCGCAAFAPSGMMCELLSDPGQTTIADATPEFGWIVHSDLPNDTQTAYHILAASSQAALEKNQGDMWDSGKVSTDNSINVPYEGSPLAVNKMYFWKVRTWNKNDKPSDWSAIQSFKTASSFQDYSTARYRLVCTPVAPIDIRTVAPGHYLIDFGKDAFGYLRWTLPPDRKADTQNPAPVEVHFGEKLENNRIDRTINKSSIRYYKVSLQLTAGTNTYDIHPPQDKRNTSGAAILIPDEIGVICPFRYIELVNCPVEPKPQQLRQITVHYPFDESASAFQCDNAILNQVWDICKYSMKATSFAGVYVDGDRERIPYEADAYINQLSHYAVDRQFCIARYSHEYLLTHSTWPTEWRQHSIMMAWADYMYTGNTESLKANYDMLKNEKLLLRYARPDGLLNTPDTKSMRNIVDWPLGERDDYDMKPVNTVVNAFHYLNLLQMRQVAQVLGKTADAQTFGQKAETVYQAFQTVFFNPQTGLYIDGDDSTHSSLHANMWPLAFGLVPETQKPAVINFVKSRGMACSVYGAQYLMESLYLAGQEDYALSLMTSMDKRSWYNMIAVGSTITLEAWDEQYKPNLDWNHAWGAVPGNIISRFVMGIQPIEAGFKKAMVRPHPGTLNNAQVTAPTIRGNIKVSFIKQGQTDYDFIVELPANTTARFVLPAKKTYTQVTLDGSPVTPLIEGTVQYLDPVGSGNHTITCR